MPIKNYTTKIDCYQSIGEIQGLLAKNGARQIMIDYNENGKPTGIAFKLVNDNQSQAFILPANIDGVLAVFKEQKVKVDIEQAEKNSLAEYSRLDICTNGFY